jgi:hypothetical protein
MGFKHGIGRQALHADGHGKGVRASGTAVNNGQGFAVSEAQCG